MLGATRWNQTWLKTTIICFDQVDAALAPGYPDDPLVEGFRVTLKRSDIATLGNLNWLNDEVCLEIKGNKSSYLTFTYLCVESLGAQALPCIYLRPRQLLYSKDFLS